MRGFVLFLKLNSTKYSFEKQCTKIKQKELFLVAKDFEMYLVYFGGGTEYKNKIKKEFFKTEAMSGTTIWLQHLDCNETLREKI